MIAATCVRSATGLRAFALDGPPAPSGVRVDRSRVDLVQRRLVDELGARLARRANPARHGAGMASRHAAPPSHPGDLSRRSQAAAARPAGSRSERAAAEPAAARSATEPAAARPATEPNTAARSAARARAHRSTDPSTRARQSTAGDRRSAAPGSATAHHRRMSCDVAAYAPVARSAHPASKLGSLDA